MESWSDFERERPEMAARARALLKRHQVAYLATVRHDDGGPRVHQICPAIVGGELYASIARPSAKLRDLRRDASYMIHFMCGEEDEEFNCRGTSSEIVAERELARIRDGANQQGIRFTEREVLFRLSVERADTTRWDLFGTPQIAAVRSRWPD